MKNLRSIDANFINGGNNSVVFKKWCVFSNGTYVIGSNYEETIDCSKSDSNSCSLETMHISCPKDQMSYATNGTYLNKTYYSIVINNTQEVFFKE